jgi:hypothetical protein
MLFLQGVPKMLVKGALSLLATIAIALFPVTSLSSGEVEYIVEKEFSSVTPVFMEGHAGDMAYVSGFTFAGDIYFNGQPIGTVSGETWLWNPPMNMVDIYDQVGLRIVNSIDGLGSFEVHAQGVAVGSSTTAAQGDITVSWSGSVANGSGFFDDNYGVSAGAIVGNFYLGSAEGTEVLRIRTGY